MITIRETADFDASPNAAVSFDRHGDFPVTVTNPFSQEDEKLLEWYFEEHLRFPFTNQVQAEKAAGSIRTYGESLFEQLFRENIDVYALYKQAVQGGVDSLSFEVVGSPEFHGLHWEALKDPDLPRAFVLDAPMVRGRSKTHTFRANVRTSPSVNLLIVTARPGGKSDVAYRTVSRPLVERLRKADLPVHIDILRPGTYRALTEHLREVRESHGVGFYHIIHFDLHGALLTFEQMQKGCETDSLIFQSRYGRSDMPEYEGRKAFLFFEGDQAGQSDPAEAGEIADLLMNHHIPIAILNACQSGKQVWDSETSLGSRLLQAGVQTVLAMGYSVTVSAASLMMEKLYEKLFRKNNLLGAICHARTELFNQKERLAYFNYRIDLEDWMLPVVYGTGGDVALPLREFSFEEKAAFFDRQAASFRAPEPEYGFVGRDTDILQVEKHLLSSIGEKKRNLIFIRGMGGAGKTTLLRHLGEWWQTTRFVRQVFYFGYDEKAWNVQQIMDEIARGLFGTGPLLPGAAVHPELMQFRAMSLQAQQKMLAQRLRSERHVLILDNLESVTGENLAIQNTLTTEERNALRNFLCDLSDGYTFVLMGSRGGEEWLVEGVGAPLRKNDIYDLPGLDEEAGSMLAERILERHVGDAKKRDKYRKTGEFRDLLKLLDGYPLPLEVVLANLARQSPEEILDALRQGIEGIDAEDAKTKTESILKCIDYSHSNLSDEAQKLLLCVAPFTGVIGIGYFSQYIEKLGQQPALADLPFDRFEDVLKEAANWGLLTPHEYPIFLRLQPIFPYFLRIRLNEASDDLRQAVETAFREYYYEVGRALWQLLDSKEAQQKQTGQVLTRLEYENLMTALKLAMNAQVSILNIYIALSHYLDTTQEQKRGLESGQMVMERLESYPSDVLAGKLGAEFVGIIDDVAKRQLLLKQYVSAEISYQKALSILLKNEGYEASQIKKISASIYHQLGMVAGEQRQWEQAEKYYSKALEIKIEFNNRYSQASTYHQLGYVAQEQRQWKQAEKYYNNALEIYIEFNDRYSQAITYGQLGLMAVEVKKWEQADQYFQKVLQIHIDFNDRHSQAKDYHNLGIAAHKQRQWEQAEKYYSNALEIKIKFNDRYSQAGTYHNLGTVAEKQRQWEQAEKYYNNALETFIEFNDRYSQAKTCHQLGTVAQEQRQWEQAREYYLKALEIWIEYSDEYHTNMVLRNSAQLWQKSKDNSLPAAIAKILETTPEKVEEMLNNSLNHG